MADNLSQLLATPLQPLREQWRSPVQAELLRTARERHEQSPDAYWAWVAEQQRWMRPWETKGTVPVGFLTLLDGADPGGASPSAPAPASAPAVGA